MPLRSSLTLASQLVLFPKDPLSSGPYPWLVFDFAVEVKPGAVVEHESTDFVNAVCARADLKSSDELNRAFGVACQASMAVF